MRRVPAAEQVVTDDAIVIVRDMRERGAAIDVSQGVDARYVRLQPVVHPDEPVGIDLHTGGGEVEPVAIRHPSRGHQEVGAGDGSVSGRAAQLQDDAVGGCRHADRIGLEQDLDAVLF